MERPPPTGPLTALVSRARTAHYPPGRIRQLPRRCTTRRGPAAGWPPTAACLSALPITSTSAWRRRTAGCPLTPPPAAASASPRVCHEIESYPKCDLNPRFYQRWDPYLTLVFALTLALALSKFFNMAIMQDKVVRADGSS